MDDDHGVGGGAASTPPLVDDDRRAAIARDYLEARLPIDEILKRHHMSYRCLYRLIDKEGWARRKPQKSKKPRVRMHTPAALLARLRKLARRRIAALEKTANDDAAGPAEHERQVKTLAALVSLVKRIEELEAPGKTDTAAAPAAMTPEEADERRQKLAQMLVTMLEQAGGQRLPDSG